MLYRFNIGKSRRGGLGLRVTPVYYMPYWRVARSGERYVVYRPSRRTLLHLAGISGTALFVLAVVVWFSGFPWSDDGRQKQAVATPQPPETKENIKTLQNLTEEIKRNLPASKVAEMDGTEADRQARWKQRSDNFRAGRGVIRVAGAVIHWLAFAALSAVVVLPLAGYPLQRVIIERSDTNELVVHKGGLWPSTRRWPPATFGHIIYTPEEESVRADNGGHTIGWRWMVKLCASSLVSDDQDPSLVDDPEIAFYIDFEKHLRDHDVPAPRSVQVLVEHLCQLTGIGVATRSEVGPEKWGLGGPWRKTTTTLASEPEVIQQVYGSLEEVPEHLREQARQLMDRSRDGQPAVWTSAGITIRDGDGNERVYRSVDEMPEEMRARYNKATGHSTKGKGRK